MMVNSVVSWPPCCVADDAKAPPTLLWRAPFAHRPPAWSRKLAIWDDILPKRVPVPTTIASYSSRSDARDRGGLVELVVGCLGGLWR